jgi:superfamily II DNA or RNA helicase
LPEILPLLDQAGYEIDLDDQRQYRTTFSFNKVSSETFSSHTWPKGHPRSGEPIVLRDYQVQVINDFLANPQSIQEVATGAGKTITTAALSYSVQDYGRSIVIVPNKSLVTQTEEDYKNVGLDVGVYFGERKEWGKTHTICTWQSLNNLLKLTQSKEAEFTIQEFIEDVVCVMVDEVHMAKADALKTLLTGVFSHVPIRWGLTGTIPKAKYEAQALFVSLGNVIGKLSASELQDKGVLAQCHVNIVQLQDNVEFTNYQSELKHLLEDKYRLDKIAELICKIKDSGNTLILVDRVAAGRELVSRIPNSVFVSGETKLTERKEEYDEVATSNDKIIVATYGVAAVGINIPRIFNLVLLEPGKSFVRVIQSIGRGIRKAEDKEFVQIWDITSSCKFAKRHLTQRKSFYKEANYPFDLEKMTYK